MANEDGSNQETEEDNGEDLDKKESDKSAKRFFSLIILTIVMFLVIGGVTVAYFTGLLDPVVNWITGSESEEISQNNTNIEKESEKIVIPITMDPLAIPIFQGNSIAATIQIKLKLETNNEEKAERINKILPIISDAFISDLHGFLPRLLKEKKKVDYKIIKKRLQIIADKVVGKGVVTNVIAKSAIEKTEWL